MSLPTDVDPLLGTVVAGRYAISRCIGRGGMGAVYLARQAALGRDVALKVIRADLVHDPEVALRFEREARAIARLSDPHIVVVYDFGQSDNTLFLAMELLAGTSLATLLRTTGRLPLRAALRITRDICVALEVAHGSGVIHRDLKPDNIMLVKADGRDDYAKVLDFGIAKMVGGADGIVTSSRVVLGTPGYVAPEVIMAGMIDDPRIDLHAVGVMLFEMLSGQMPFVAPTPSAVLVAQAAFDAPLVSSLVPGLPQPVVELVRRLTARRPGDRPADARTVIAAIDELAGLTDIPDIPDIPAASISSLALGPAQASSSTAVLGSISSSGTSVFEGPFDGVAGVVGAPIPSSTLVPPTTSTATLTAAAVPPATAGRVRLGLVAAMLGLVAMVGVAVLLRSTSTPPVVVATTTTAPSLGAAPTPPSAPPPPPPTMGGAPDADAPEASVSAVAAAVVPSRPPPALTRPKPSPAPPSTTEAATETPPPPSLTSALVKQGIVQSLGKASACTNTNIKLAPSGPGLFIDHCPSYQTLEGSRQVSLTLAPDGSVLSARFADAATNDNRLGACVLQSLLAWKLLPFAAAEPVEITQRVTFEPCVPINGKCVF